MTEEETELYAMAEAVLFASGEPVETGKLAQVLGISAQQVLEIIQHLKERYEETNSALVEQAGLEKTPKNSISVLPVINIKQTNIIIIKLIFAPTSPNAQTNG